MTRRPAWTTALLALGAVVASVSGAAAADLGDLRRALERDDRAAVERWLAAEARAREADPLAPLAGRSSPPALHERAASLAGEELMVSVLAQTWLRSSDPGIKQRLLARLDAAQAARQALDRDVQQAARAQGPRPLVLTRAFAAGTGQGGTLAPPSQEFSPEEPAIDVRFAYEGGMPGEALTSRWLFLSGGGREFARADVTLGKEADIGQFHFSPASGTSWLEGVYRVEILGRGTVLGEVDFVVAARRAAAGAPPAGPVTTGPQPSRQPPTAPSATAQATVLNATLAMDVENGQAKDPVLEFTTARKRLVLWAHVQAPSGGALTARWYALDGGDRLLGEHTLTLPPGESRMAFWLEVASDKIKFKRGRFRVDLVAGDRVLQQLPFGIRQAGFLEEVAGALEQLGRELDKAIKGESK